MSKTCLERHDDIGTNGPWCNVLLWTDFCLLQMQPLRFVLLNSYSLVKIKFFHRFLFKSIAKIVKLLFCRSSRWWLLLLLDQNSRCYERYTKQNSNLINGYDLREIDFLETFAVSGTRFSKIQNYEGSRHI